MTGAVAAAGVATLKHQHFVAFSSDLCQQPTSLPVSSPSLFWYISRMSPTSVTQQKLKRLWILLARLYLAAAT